MHYCIFFFNDTSTTEIYTSLHTLSLHDALPILRWTSCCTRHGRGSTRRRTSGARSCPRPAKRRSASAPTFRKAPSARRSEEHTSELQSLMRNSYAVFCLKKKKNTTIRNAHATNLNPTNKYHKGDEQAKPH